MYLHDHSSVEANDIVSYAEAYRMIREITGTGAGKGPVVSIHDGFRNTDAWVGYLPGADRLALDQHPYFAFNGGPALEPIDTGVGAGAGGEWVGRACGWASRSNQRSVHMFLDRTTH